MSCKPDLVETFSDPYLGHLFGDWSHGIDHARCGHCGLYQHAFTGQDKKACPVAAALELGPGGICDAPDEDFANAWAIRPELSWSDIYQDREAPDVEQFESREELFDWLD